MKLLALIFLCVTLSLTAHATRGDITCENDSGTAPLVDMHLTYNEEAFENIIIKEVKSIDDYTPLTDKTQSKEQIKSAKRTSSSSKEIDNFQLTTDTSTYNFEFNHSDEGSYVKVVSVTDSTVKKSLHGYDLFYCWIGRPEDVSDLSKLLRKL